MYFKKSYSIIYSERPQIRENIWEADRVIRYKVMTRHLTWGGEYTIQYTDDVL